MNMIYCTTKLTIRNTTSHIMKNAESGAVTVLLSNGIKSQKHKVVNISRQQRSRGLIG